MAEVSARTGRPYLRLAVLAGLLAAGALAAAFTPLGDYLTREGIGETIAWLRGSRAAPLVYVAVYTAATALAIPGSILTMAGGAMFGVLWGTIYTTVGANLGANAAFGVARFLGRGGIERLAGSRLDRLDRATADHGFRGLLALRLIPVVPFNALNFGSGLTAMRWPTYASATVIGIFPGTLVYTMFADALLAGSQEASREALFRVLASGALLIVLSFLPTLARRLGLRLPGATAVVSALLLAQGAWPGSSFATPAAAQSLPDHGAFSEVLAAFVRQPAVDYGALTERREGLDEYLATLAAVPPEALSSADRHDRLAFWINAYNACMLKLVADHYPIERDGRLLARITNSVAGRPSNSVWQIPDVFTRRHCRVAGEERSQDDIEHSIIRPMGDPRIHFAVNCAARSCPPLWPEAYTGAELERQLDRAVSGLIGNPEHFRLEEDGTLRLNRVLDWYKDDFGGLSGLRIFFSDFVGGELAPKILDERTTIDFFEYDWTLNDTGR